MPETNREAMAPLPRRLRQGGRESGQRRDGAYGAWAGDSNFSQTNNCLDLEVRYPVRGDRTRWWRASASLVVTWETHPRPETHGLRSSNSSDLERTFQMTRLHNVTGELHAEPPWTSGDRQVQCLQAVIANNAIGVHALRVPSCITLEERRNYMNFHPECESEEFRLSSM